MSEVRPFRYESSVKTLWDSEPGRQKWETSRFWLVRVLFKDNPEPQELVSDCEPVVTDSFVAFWNAFAVEEENTISRVINIASDEVSRVNWRFIESSHTFWLDTDSGGVTPID